MNIPKISSELAEETGLHIGDGTMNYYKNGRKICGSYALRGHIIDDKKHYNFRIKQLYKELYGLDISLREMPSTGCYGFQKWSNDLVNFKHRVLNLPLGKKLNIIVPEQFKYKFSEDLIRGLFDTDGTLYLENKNKKLYPRIIICDISLKLISQISKLINNSGIRSTFYISRREQKNWNDLGVVEVRGREMVEKWFKIIRPSNPKFWDKYQFYLDSS
ncbi:MAG: hypothetical protein CMH64_03270 [Nanoarchaeota archaeon]|nr:hypothetical protein [Nanoarchaeota archaeon]|tara:strand:- start:218 stop:868 length:651 start_codon:yes stop_codon:yes gene_type:complete